MSELIFRFRFRRLPARWAPAKPGMPDWASRNHDMTSYICIQHVSNYTVRTTRYFTYIIIRSLLCEAEMAADVVRYEVRFPIPSHVCNLPLYAEQESPRQCVILFIFF